ncbi:hypothetical protein GCM10027028_66350 [Streptomyces sundarbansensis]
MLLFGLYCGDESYERYMISFIGNCEAGRFICLLECGSTPKQGSMKDHCFCDTCVYIDVKQ